MVGDYSHYPDTGCSDGGPSCLNCQLAVCVEDTRIPAPTQRRITHRQRARELIRQGSDTGAVAERLGISRRTVQRMVANGN